MGINNDVFVLPWFRRVLKVQPQLESRFGLPHAGPHHWEFLPSLEQPLGHDRPTALGFENAAMVIPRFAPPNTGQSHQPEFRRPQAQHLRLRGFPIFQINRARISPAYGPIATNRNSMNEKDHEVLQSGDISPAKVYDGFEDFSGGYT